MGPCRLRLDLISGLRLPTLKADDADVAQGRPKHDNLLVCGSLAAATTLLWTDDLHFT